MRRLTSSFYVYALFLLFFFFSSRRRHTRLQGDWSSDVCSSDLVRADRRRHPRDSLRVGGRRRPGHVAGAGQRPHRRQPDEDRKSTRLNSSHLVISYAVFCLKKKKKVNDELY